MADEGKRKKTKKIDVVSKEANEEILKEEAKEEVTEEVIEEAIEEILKEEAKEEVTFKVSSVFSVDEKLFIMKLIANGYRPFDIVKKARANLKLTEEKQRRLSLNVRTMEQLVKAMEA